MNIRDDGPWQHHLRLAGTARDTPLDPAEAIRRIDDELAVRDLIVRYTYYHDAGDLEAKLALHHSDCVLHHNSGDLRGLEAIRAFFAAGPPNAEVQDMKHYATNTLVRFINRDRAVATSFFIWTATRIMTPNFSIATVGGGWYVDVVLRADNGWLFIERTIQRGFDFYLPGVPSFGKLLMGVEGQPREAIEKMKREGLIDDIDRSGGQP